MLEVQTHIQFSVVSGPKFTGLFSLNAGGIAGDHLSFDFGYLDAFRRHSRSKFEVA